MRTFWAACTLGLEPVLADELRALGAADVTARRGGATFAGELATGYRACLWLRSAVRVQEELARGRARSREELYALASRVDWAASITPLQTLAVDASVRDSFANDTRFPALVVKDAACDRFRDATGRRPDVDRERPDLPIKLVLQRDEAILYRDLSGEPLHKRGYREIQHRSPLNEALAAGLLLLTDWDRSSPLCDPMCGSGTFLIEAALLAGDRAPGLARTFAFERWCDLETAAWRALYDEAEQRAAAGTARGLPELAGNDRHPGALALARQAAAAAGLDRAIRFVHGDVRDFAPPSPPHTVVCNPPWGERLAAPPEELAASWRSLGEFLHRRCAGATAWLLCGNADLTRWLGLRSHRKTPVRVGPIDARWLGYRIDAATAARPDVQG